MKDKVLTSLKQKNCVLCGKAKEAEEFYNANAGKFNIQSFTSLFETELIEFQKKETGILGAEFDNISLETDCYWIICDNENIVFYYNMLITNGKKEIEDFIFADVALTLLSDKKICLLMGTQVIRQIYEAISSNYFFCEKYYPIFFSEDWLLKPYKNRIIEYAQFGELMDVYIYSNSDVQMYSTKILDIKSHSFIKISVSDSTFNGLFPQCRNDRSFISSWLYRRFERDDMYYGTLMMAREDENIIRMISDGYNDEDIVEELSKLDFYSKNSIEENIRINLDRVKETDEKSDIKLYPLLLEAMELIPYINLDEWSPWLLCKVIMQIEEKLHILHDKNVDYDMLVRNICGSELIIYPSIAAFWGLDNKEYYKVVSYGRVEYLSYNDYLKRYIGNVRKILELQKIDETI